MKLSTLTRMAFAAVVTAAITGCNIDAEHEKFVKDQRASFEVHRLEIAYQVAEQQYRVGDMAKCRESIKSALAVSTPYAPLRLLAARVELEGGSLEVAATHLKEAIKIDPAKAEPLYYLGVVYQRWQKFDTALDYYEQASDKSPSEALYVLAVAEMRITLGQLEEARQFLEDKSAFFEQSAAMRVALAHIAVLQRDASAAARYYHDATILLPEDKNLRWTYARALYDAGRYGDAVRILDELRRDPPTMPKAVSKKDNVDAVVEQQTAASIKVSILMTLGESYLALNRPMDGRDCFQEIIRAQPGNASAYLALAQTGLMTNDLATTMAAAQKAARFAPDNVQAMILQATVLQKQSKWTESLEMLNKAVKVEPNNGTVLCLQGLARMELGQKDAAAESFEKAVAVNPRDAWAGELLERARPGAVIPPTSPTPAAAATTPPASEEVILSTPVHTNAPAVLELLPLPETVNVP